MDHHGIKSATITLEYERRFPWRTWHFGGLAVIKNKSKHALDSLPKIHTKHTPK
jgi:hypothetical protein